MRRLIVGGCVVCGLPSALSAQLLPPGATPQLLTSGYRFTEGPLDDHAGGLYFSDLDMTHVQSRIYRYDIAGHTTTLVDPNSGGTNGTYFSLNGQVIACERDRRQMTLRLSSNVATVQQVLATSWQGAAFNGPNDVVADDQGGIYFTDPDFENRQSVPEATYYLSSAGVLSRVVTGIVRPNGVVLSPDGRTLYVAAWSARLIRAYDVTSPGVLTNGRNFVTNLPAGPDGITIDPSGNLYASITTRVRAWSPAGQQLMEVTVPQSSTNVEIGGPTGKTLFITAGTALYGVDLNVATITAAWGVNNPGSWSSGANWTGGLAPNGVDHVATFGSAITAPTTVTVNEPRTVGTINFDNANRYTLAGSGTLSLDVSTGAAAINVTAGSHSIEAPLALNDNVMVNVTPPGSGVSLADLRAAGVVITKAGAGVLSVNTLRAAALVVNAGTVSVLTNGSHPGTSKVATFLIAGGASPTATLDLNDNDLVIGSGTPRTIVEAQLKSARADGAWTGNGITSSAARNLATTGLAVLSGAEYDSVGGTGSFSGQAYAATDTLVKYTWNGDANLDGRVTFDDYVRIDTGFNSGLTGWLNGDFNYSGSVNFDDYVLIDIAFNAQAGTLGRAVEYLNGEDRTEADVSDGPRQVLRHFDEFGTSYAASFLAAIPEPSELAIIGVLLHAAANPRRRRTCNATPW